MKANVQSAGELIKYLVLIAVAVYVLLPLIYVFSLSLRKSNEMFLTIFIPKTVTFSNYVDAWYQVHLGMLYKNSIIVSFSSIFLTLLISSIAAYAFSKKIFIAGKFLFILLLTGIMIPPHAIVLPLFINLHSWGLVDTYFALILPYTALGIPLSILILTDYFRSIPAEIEEAAVIDGCSFFGIYRRIILPLAKPAIGALIILLLLQNWNEFIFAITFIQNSDLKTIPAGLVEFQGQYREFWGQMSAAIMLTILPMLAVYLLLQRRFTEGIALGALKE